MNVAVIVLQEADDRLGDDGLLGRGGISNYPLSFVSASSAFRMADGERRCTKTWLVLSCVICFLLEIISSQIYIIYKYDGY